MRAFGAIVLKELRELVTFQTLAPMLVVVVIYGFIGRAIRGERAKESGPELVLVVDEDRSRPAESIRALLESAGFVLLDAPDTAAALAEAREVDAGWVVVLPAGLGDSVAARRPAGIEAYALVRGFAVSWMMRSGRFGAALRGINAELVRERLAADRPGEPPERALEPVTIRQFVMVRDRVAPGTPEQLAEVAMSQTVLIPAILLLLIIVASQMIAGSVGQEKENKTLETLLTVPVNRMTVVLGKMLGAVLFALVSSALVFAALYYYMGSMTGGAGPGTAIAAALGIAPGPGDWLLLGLALFLAVVCALSLVSVLAVFADDARTAQLATTPVMVLVLLPFMLTTFLDVGSAALPMRVLVYAIPFSYPFLIQRAAMFGDYRLIAFGLGYMAAFAALMVFIAARLYSTDRILTARLNLRRRR
ncbi:MAG: ABC transporter permease [bacterium]